MDNNTIKAHVWFNRDGLSGSLWAILYNIKANQFVLRDELGAVHLPSHEDVLNKSHIIAEAGMSITWYLHKNSAPMKLEIKGRPECSITITPLQPYKMKYAIDNEIERIDLGFYIQCCIELCENFLVSDIKAE